MALKCRWVFSIWLVLDVAVGQISPVTSYNFNETKDTFASNVSKTIWTPAELRLIGLRSLMTGVGIHAYIVPTSDAHNSRQISPADACRAWLTGFSGDAGTAVVTASEALVWTDGRHWTLFETEANLNLWRLMKEEIDISIEDWLVQNLPSGTVVAVDPMTLSRAAWSTLYVTLKAAKIELLAYPNNLVDMVRTLMNELPPVRANNNMVPHTLQYTGRTSSLKIAEIQQQMSSSGASALVLTALDEIAYILNLRGSDIPFNPVFFSYLILRADRPLNSSILFWRNGILPGSYIEIHQFLEGISIDCHPYEDFFDYLTNMSNELGQGKIWVPADASHAVHLAIEKGLSRIISAPVSPVALMKLVKNPVELNGLSNAHIRDAVVMIASFFWIEQRLAHVVNPSFESHLANFINSQRRVENLFLEPSTRTIVAAGTNSAIISHQTQSNMHPNSQRITTQDILLMDSGGHYLDGTTHLTRTRHMGNCTEAQRRAFTHVLKGNIQLATSVMPMGTKGHTIDVLARKFVWDLGMDYPHETGNGVGHFLRIHDLPAKIQSSVTPNDPGITPNMIYSNGPGYYVVGEFGIRHQDMLQTILVNNNTDHPLAAGLIGDFSGEGIVGFETLTLVPHQTSCIDVKLLSDFEIKYLNDYHVKINATIGPILLQHQLWREHAWLVKECAPISSATAILMKAAPTLTAICVIGLWFRI